MLRMTPDSLKPETCADLYLMKVFPGQRNRTAHSPQPHRLQRDWHALVSMSGQGGAGERARSAV